MSERNRRPLLSLISTHFISRTDVLIWSVLIIFVAGCDLLAPWMIKTAIDAIVEPFNTAGLEGIEASRNAAFRQVLWAAFGIAVLVAAQYFARRFLASRQNNRIFTGAAQLRNEIYVSLQAQSLDFHGEHSSAGLLTNLTTDIQNLQEAALEILSEVPFDCCLLIGVLLSMWLLNPMLAVIVGVIPALAILASVFIARGTAAHQYKAMKKTEALTAALQESLNGVRALQTFDSGQQQQRISVLAEEHCSELESAGELRATVAPLFSLADYAGILTVLIAGGWCSLHGTLSAGGLIAFFAYMEMAADPMMRAAHVLPRVQAADVSAERIAQLLAQTLPQEVEQRHAIKSAFQGALEFRKVSFQYPKGNRPALTEIDFTVSAGETVAIIGANGSGKSTLIDLLLKLRKPSSGEVRCNGNNLDLTTGAEWRTFIRTVPQETTIFNRSIAENICLGFGTLRDAEEAARRAGLDEFIRRLPNGYDSIPGERGMFLSGGERQRIAIARVFLSNPGIVVLDEPTSFLDQRTERKLLPVIQNLCIGRTAFLISHRLDVLAHATRALLLDEGRQIFFGSTREVWEHFPEYRAFFPSEWQANEEVCVSGELKR